MGHIIFEEIDRLDLKDGDWIDIKRQMSYGDKDDLSRAMMRIQVNAAKLRAASSNGALTEDALAEMSDVEVSTGKLELLAINIKSWSFKDQKQEPLPVNRQTVRMLDEDTANLVLAEIARRNPKKKVGGSISTS